MTENKIKLGTFGILQRHGKILLGLRSADDKSFPNKWGHIGGGVEFGEDVATTLTREFMEEVGMQVFVKRDYTAVHEYITPDRHVLLVFKEVMAGSDLVEPQPLDGIQKVAWFSFKEIEELCRTNQSTPLTWTATLGFESHRLEKPNKTLT
jgi:8-oxo-dGTP pyrophosphatase MutT (NUDIX family)